MSNQVEQNQSKNVKVTKFIFDYQAKIATIERDPRERLDPRWSLARPFTPSEPTFLINIYNWAPEQYSP